MRRLVSSLLGTALLAGVADAQMKPAEVQWKSAQPSAVKPASFEQPAEQLPAPAVHQPVPRLEELRHALPINLPTAMQLANARPLDVQIAARQVQVAMAQWERARVLWVPSLVSGVDWFHHEGLAQNFEGDIVRNSRSSFMVGGGMNAVFGVNDAIFNPLAARQELGARRAFQQAASNDAALAVAESYFNVQQARGELANALLYVQQAEELVRRTKQLAEGLAPPMEASRARVELARRQQAVASIRERWNTASAELVRLLRLDPSAVVEPVEPANLTIQLIEPTLTLDDLIVMGLQARPELAQYQAIVQATVTRLRQEKLRPLIPSILMRGVSTNPSGSLAAGAFGGGRGGTIGSMQGRFDYDIQVLWELQNFGLGNKARIDERRAEREVAVLELFRIQDRIAAEVARAHAQYVSARDRLAFAEPAMRDALDTLQKNMEGLSQTRRAGNLLILIVRPQEVVAALQALAQANSDYYSAVADFNRSQFRLYRAIGYAAQALPAAVAKEAGEPKK